MMQNIRREKIKSHSHLLTSASAEMYMQKVLKESKEAIMKEFFKMAKTIKLATKKEELERMFRDMDVDKGGTIDFGEFKDVIFRVLDGGFLPLSLFFSLLLLSAPLSGPTN